MASLEIPELKMEVYSVGKAWKSHMRHVHHDTGGYILCILAVYTYNQHVLGIWWVLPGFPVDENIVYN